MNASGEDLHTMLADVSGTSVHRLRITKGSDRSVVPNTKGTTIEETGLRESSVIHIKDLGTLNTVRNRYNYIGSGTREQTAVGNTPQFTDS